MKFMKNKLILITTSAAWMLMIIAGLGFLWDYKSAPGMAAAAPPQWPADSHLQPASDRATLVMLAHPHCPCTRASIGELARMMAQAPGRVTAYVLFVKPANFAEGWEKTDLWASATAIPGVSVVEDDGGLEARRFHAATSGQTMLYDEDGKLIFSGGMTGARGHEGDNAGRTAIVSLLTVDEANESETPVFGCPLFAQTDECRTTKEYDRARYNY
jgi:glyoxylase-like metal-dependent hydrolase (beta-lactamase superfamily II)